MGQDKCLSLYLRAIRIASWMMLVASPLIAVALTGSVTGTSPFSIDAWNTTWNDELGYYRAVRIMREHGLSCGIAGYNENPARLPQYSFGPYSPLTYLPYLLFSFLTGYHSHNYIWIINLLLALLSNSIIVLFLRPSIKRSLILSLFFSLQFIAARYAFSGMIEESYIFFAVVYIICCLRLSKNTESVARQSIAAYVAVLCTFLLLWGAMRPFMIALALPPLCMLLHRGRYLLNKTAAAIAIALSASGALSLYLYSSYNLQAHYFSGDSLQQRIGTYYNAGIHGVLDMNVTALATSWESLLIGGWRGVIVFSFFTLMILLSLVVVRLWRTNNRNYSVFVTAFIVSGFLIYEANVLLYTPEQLHRMLLSIDVALAVLLVFTDHTKMQASLIFVGVSTILCCGTLLYRPESFTLPQIQANSVNTEDGKSAQFSEFDSLFPVLENPWDNTIAKCAEGNELNIYFALPSHITTNTCERSYLEHALRSKTLKSRYLCLVASSDLYDLACASGDIIYSDDYHIIFCISDS